MDDLGKRLRDLVQRNVLRGEFTLSSGKKSTYYIDGKITTLSAEGAWLVGLLMARALAKDDVRAIGGLTLGADPIVASVAAMSFQEGRPIQAFIVRKEPKSHGTSRWIEGPAIDRGTRVALVDDVITTGASVLKAAEHVVAESGAQVVKVLCVLDRLEGGREAIEKAGYAFQPLVSIKDLVL